MILTIVGALFSGLWIHGHLVYIAGVFMALVMANGAGRASGTAHLLFIFGFLFEQILTCVSGGGYGEFFPNRTKGGTTLNGSPLCLRHALSFISDFWLGSFRPEWRHQNVPQA